MIASSHSVSKHPPGAADAHRGTLDFAHGTGYEEGVGYGCKVGAHFGNGRAAPPGKMWGLTLHH